MSKALQSTIANNLYWFVASLIVAVLVWFVAKIEANPVNQRSYTRPISILVDETMIITSQSSENARVFVTAQESTLNILQPDDITVSVDLTGRVAGSHTVPLDVDISRLASSDTQPTQITVQIEPRFSQQVPVRINLDNLPVSYNAEISERDVFQAIVSGATSNVNQVVIIEGSVDLANQQATGQLERVVSLQAIDADGDVVNNVAIEPSSLLVGITISQRENIRTFTVRPDIDFNSLPENYELTDIYYAPDTVVLDGQPEILDSLGETIDTIPITLENRTGNFTVEVPLDLPQDSGIINLSEDGIIRVEIFINEEEATLPLENIPVRTIGADGNGNTTLTLNPTSISVVLTVPASEIELISADNVQAIIDVTDLDIGTHAVTPRIEINQGQINLDSADILLIPSEVTVTINELQPETTPELTPEVRSTSEADD